MSQIYATVCIAGRGFNEITHSPSTKRKLDRIRILQIEHVPISFTEWAQSIIGSNPASDVLPFNVIAITFSG